jgi:hypothetical protein
MYPAANHFLKIDLSIGRGGNATGSYVILYVQTPCRAADDFSNSSRQRYRNPRSFAETIFLARKNFGQCRLSGIYQLPHGVALFCEDRAEEGCDPGYANTLMDF